MRQAELQEELVDFWFDSSSFFPLLPADEKHALQGDSCCKPSRQYVDLQLGDFSGEPNYACNGVGLYTRQDKDATMLTPHPERPMSIPLLSDAHFNEKGAAEFDLTALCLTNPPVTEQDCPINLPQQICLQSPDQAQGSAK